MPLFKVLDEYGCQSLTFVSDAASGLNAIIAIHSTRRGPAFGGIRTLSYQTQSAGVTDAVRLAQGEARVGAADPADGDVQRGGHHDDVEQIGEACPEPEISKQVVHGENQCSGMLWDTSSETPKP